jgi:hypothetical protein
MTGRAHAAGNFRVRQTIVPSEPFVTGAANAGGFERTPIGQKPKKNGYENSLLQAWRTMVQDSGTPKEASKTVLAAKQAASEVGLEAYRSKDFRETMKALASFGVLREPRHKVTITFPLPDELRLLDIDTEEERAYAALQLIHAGESLGLSGEPLRIWLYRTALAAFRQDDHYRELKDKVFRMLYFEGASDV